MLTRRICQRDCAARGARDTGTALEVNNSSLVKKERRLNCYDNYRCMLRWCEKLSVPVIVDSDAHDPSWVGRLDLAEELLREVRFPEELVLNTLTDLRVSGSLGSLALTPDKGVKGIRNLSVSNCGLDSLDISGCPKIEMMDCWHNNLTTLDLSKNIRLEVQGETAEETIEKFRAFEVK